MTWLCNGTIRLKALKTYGSNPNSSSQAKDVALTYFTFWYLPSSGDGYVIAASQGIVISYLYTIPWQNSLSESRLPLYGWNIADTAYNTIQSINLKVGLEDARDIGLLLSPNQSERSIQSEFSGCTIVTFHFNEEHVLFTQWEIVCNWFHMMPVEPIK